MHKDYSEMLKSTSTNFGDRMANKNAAAFLVEQLRLKGAGRLNAKSCP